LANRTSINILAASEKLATMFNQREAVEAILTATKIAGR
jgi:hypothetical protein